MMDLDTPTLLLNGPAADRNIARAAAFTVDKPVRLRPHFKNHKCVTLARRQLAGGCCVGVTTAKLAEAEILVAHGFTDLLVANQCVGSIKATRLATVNRKATVRAAVDAIENVVEIGRAAVAVGVVVGLLVEVDVGMGRCGVAPGKAVLDLATRMADVPGVRFDGLQAYEGHAMMVLNPVERAAVARGSMQQAVDSRRLLEASGVPVKIVSGAGTGSYRTSGSMPGVDELQIGSYVTMDWTYRGRCEAEFETALTVLSTVVSTSAKHFVCDVGVKGVGHEMGPPMVKGTSLVARFLAEEHCVVDAPGHSYKVGDKIELIPSHCCTTCNLHRELTVVDDAGVILDRWPIEASGALT
ncbi:MAG: alanine racemase [Planctomycetia bacterium]